MKNVIPLPVRCCLPVITWALALALGPGSTLAAAPKAGPGNKVTKVAKATLTAKVAKTTKATTLAGRSHSKSISSTSRSIAGKSTARRPGPAIVNLPAPPAAVLSALYEPTIRTGCIDAPAGAGALSASDLQALAAQALKSPLRASPEAQGAPGACANFASVSLPGAADTAASYALLPAGAERAFVSTRGGAAATAAAHWRDIEFSPVGQREVWLPSGGAGPNGADLADEIPASLQHELGLLVKQMRKQTATPDSTWVRAWIEGEGDAATLLAVELVDELSGRAVDSVLWMARDHEPGAFISARGVEYERLLWQSPVDYKRISRGVGSTSQLVKKRVMLKAKGKARPRMVVRSFMVRGHHIGIDFAAPTGTPVVAVAEGDVIFSGWRGGYGNLVVVQHGSELATYYAHLSAFAPELAEGSRVRRGQTLGLVGSTGFSTGPHLHFEIRKDARYVDPTKPEQRLAAWTLRADEHEAVLTRLLHLEATRASGFARSARVQQMVLRPLGTAEGPGQ